MRLLIVTQKADKDDPVLGFFHGWIREFAKHFEAIIVICLEEGQHEFPSNVRVLSLGKEKHPSRARYLKNLYSYIWKERANYDAVFVHMNPEYVVLAGLLWRAMGKRISLWYTHKSVNAKLYFAEKLAHRIYSASKESFRLKSRKLMIFGHGIDVDMYSPKPDPKKDEAIRVITVGRISLVKDYGTMIEAIGCVASAGNLIHLDVIGGPVHALDHGYFETIKQSVHKLGLDDKISFLGAMMPEKAVEYLQRSDIFVNTSRTGSLDKAPLEAMSTGLVVMSSNDALRPILEPFHLYFEPGNAERLAEMIASHASDPNRKGIGDKLRAYVALNCSLTTLIGRISGDIKESYGNSK